MKEYDEITQRLYTMYRYLVNVIIFGHSFVKNFRYHGKVGTSRRIKQKKKLDMLVLLKNLEILGRLNLNSYLRN